MLAHPRSPAYDVYALASAGAGVCQAPQSKRRTISAVMSSWTVFFRPEFLSSMTVREGQPKGWPVSFCTGSWQTLAHRLHSDCQADRDGFLKQKETRHV